MACGENIETDYAYVDEKATLADSRLSNKNIILKSFRFSIIRLKIIGIITNKTEQININVECSALFCSTIVSPDQCLQLVNE